MHAPRITPARYHAWTERLDRIRTAGRWRQVRTLDATSPTRGHVDGRDVIIACSNDYLGLSWHPDVRQAAVGGGATGSRLISGARPAHRALEAAIEAWFGRPALLFNSGWHANQAVFSTVCGAGQTVASDAANHASIIDGLRLSKAHRVILPHGARVVPDHVDLVVVEGLFSMDGDRADLSAHPCGPWLAVDEAHSVGCIGPGGRGVAAEQGVEPDILIGTFGKAFGGAGAFVVGPPELIELLVNEGRAFIFSTALPEPVAAQALAALRAADDEHRERLRANVTRIRSALDQQGWRAPGVDHIVPVKVGDRAMALSQQLLDRGVFAPGIRWPTVARGEERIRLTVSAAHTPDELDRIVDALGAP